MFSVEQRTLAHLHVATSVYLVGTWDGCLIGWEVGQLDWEGWE